MAADTSELPDELQAKPKAFPDEGTRLEYLEALGTMLAGKRDAAIKARKESGIERIWTACEEAYAGIDEANRAEFGSPSWTKGTTMAAPLQANATQNAGGKSNAYVRLTTRYVDMGAAKLSEIVLPIDDKPFSFGPTPVPDLVERKDDTTPLMDEMGRAVYRPVRDDEMAGFVEQNPAMAFMEAQEGQQAQPMVPATVKDAVAEALAKAKKAAEKAENRVFDWLVEAKYPMQMRKVIFDGARLGAGVLKGPFPEVRTGRAVVAGKLKISKRIAPGCKWVDVWNFFPGQGCGEDIQEADEVWERDFLTAGGLKGLKKLADHAGRPLYDSRAIDKVIEEGPGKCNTEEHRDDKVNKHRYPVWYMTGTLTRKDLEAMEMPGLEDLPDELVEMHCIATLVNDSVIRVTLNPLEESGSFGYRIFNWSRRAGYWAGVGVAEQVAMPQRMVNAGTRAVLNNAGKSAGTQIVVDQNAVTPADGSWDLNVGDKLWLLNAAGITDDVRKVFEMYKVPNLTAELMPIIEYGFRLAEEASNIPLISQGQTGPQDPQTFGQAELQNSNANTLLRQLAYGLDDSVTEPLINDYYEWLLLDPDVPADEKGDFQINASGSIALVEKAIQEFTLIQMLGLTVNPVWGQDPKKMFAEVMRSKRLDPDRTAYSEEELARMQQSQQPAPAVQVAQIREQGAMQREQLRSQTTMQRAQLDTDRDAVYAQAERDRVQIERDSRERELTLKREIALADFASKNQLSLEDARTRLAETAMKLRTQIVLAGKDGRGPQVSTPPTEPPGRAQPGEAYQH